MEGGEVSTLSYRYYDMQQLILGLGAWGAVTGTPTSILAMAIAIAAMAIAIALPFACILRWKSIIDMQKKELEEMRMKPAGPKLWPLVGCYFEARRNFHRLHDWTLSFFSSHNRTYRLRYFLFSPSVFLTVDPLNVEHILKTRFHNYPKGNSTSSRFYDLLGDGIFNVDGNLWKRHRKIASLEFSSKKLKDFNTMTFREDAVKLLEVLHIAATSNTQVDIQDLLMRMTMDSICKVAFGLDVGSLCPSLPDTPFGKAFDSANEICMHRMLNPFWRLCKALNVGKEKKLKQDIATLQSFTTNVIQKRKLDIKARTTQVNNSLEASGEDLLSRLITFNLFGERYTDKELQDAILNFMIAGRDTTAITLSWFLYCVCKHPHVGERIYDETKNILGLQEGIQHCHFREVASRLTYQSLSKMHYLHAALSETLRLYPPVPRDGKAVVEDDVLPDGTCVKGGDIIIYVPYSMGRMEFIWGKDAVHYNPDRWLKDGVYQNESPFKFTAFQAGPRICLGKESAYLQMMMTGALLLQFFKFSLVPRHVVQYRVLIVMPMEFGLLLHVYLR